MIKTKRTIKLSLKKAGSSSNVYQHAAKAKETEDQSHRESLALSPGERTSSQPTGTFTAA